VVQDDEKHGGAAEEDREVIERVVGYHFGGWELGSGEKEGVECLGRNEIGFWKLGRWELTECCLIQERRIEQSAIGGVGIQMFGGRPSEATIRVSRHRHVIVYGRFNAIA
jgi:hypothetical protein